MLLQSDILQASHFPKQDDGSTCHLQTLTLIRTMSDYLLEMLLFVFRPTTRTDSMWGGRGGTTQFL